MTKYEITYLTVGEESANAAAIRDILAKHEASIVSVSPWVGRRKLAYAIKKQEQAFYTTVVFEAEPSAVKPLSDEVERSDAILRFLLVYFIAQPERGGTGEPDLSEPKMVKPETKPEEKAPEGMDEATLKTAAEDEAKKHLDSGASRTKSKRKPQKATAEETKALDEKLEELLKEDITA